jgi:hypothetical protein
MTKKLLILYDLTIDLTPNSPVLSLASFYLHSITRLSHGIGFPEKSRYLE